MSNKKLNSQLGECEGWVCGEVLKRNSLPVNRIEVDSLTEAIRELIEEYFKDGWLPDMICDLGCSGDRIFELTPTELMYPPEGGTQELTITVGKSDKWTIS